MPTTNITLAIDNTLLPTAIAALCWRAGWTATIDDGNGNQIANPVTAAQAAKAFVIAHIRSTVVDYQTAQAQAGVTAPAANLIN